jgi:formylglycine-generating enzyme required for sulfatase activity
MPLSPGLILKNRYRIVKLLGQGGFGAVYKAWDLNLERPRALKENLDTSPEARRQFKLEAQILCDLTHPNLPKVIDHFVTTQGQYMVMEFVEGEDLREVIERTGRPLPETQALVWVGQICEALEYLHSHVPPIIHRDIKPANIKITPDGTAMLVDFGIAKVYDPKLSTTLGARAITPGYSPQEQYGMGPTDARSDIYALGATLYHLLTGQQPPESIQRNINDDMAPPRQQNPLISTGAEAAILKAMQMHPSQRFPSVTEFKDALGAEYTRVDAGNETMNLFTPPIGTTSVHPANAQAAAPSVHATEAIGDGLQSRPARTPTEATPARRAVPWPWIGGLVVVISFAVILGFNLFGGKPAEPAPDYPATRTALALLWTATASSTPRSTETPTVAPSATRTTRPTNTPNPTAPPTQIVDPFGVPMALVPAGQFEMGADADIAIRACLDLCPDCECTYGLFGNEEPPHLVYLDEFYIDLYEVTNGRYAECVRDGVCDPPLSMASRARQSYYRDPAYADYPVIYVTWFMAEAYCEWRGGSLPTEAQWEKAARGTAGIIYPWGKYFDDNRGNFCDANCTLNKANKDWDDGYADTAPVGSYPSGCSTYGLFDMGGNVIEWVKDWYGISYYAESPSDNPTGPVEGVYRSLRGGAWYYSADYMRTTNRVRTSPENANDRIGFRCVRSP